MRYPNSFSVFQKQTKNHQAQFLFLPLCYIVSVLCWPTFLSDGPSHICATWLRILTLLGPAMARLHAVALRPEWLNVVVVVTVLLVEGFLELLSVVDWWVHSGFAVQLVLLAPVWVFNFLVDFLSGKQGPFLTLAKVSSLITDRDAPVSTSICVSTPSRLTCTV